MKIIASYTLTMVPWGSQVVTVLRSERAGGAGSEGGGLAPGGRGGHDGGGHDYDLAPLVGVVVVMLMVMRVITTRVVMRVVIALMVMKVRLAKGLCHLRGRIF